MTVEAPLAPFVGTWRGTGSGEFPSVGTFAYEEEIRFVDVGTQDLMYLQRAWDPESGKVLHHEVGFWRVIDIGADYWVLVATYAQPRRTEVLQGPMSNGHTLLVSTNATAVRGARRIVSTQREFRLVGDELTYEFMMATRVLSRRKRHLTGTLRRAPDPQPTA